MSIYSCAHETVAIIYSAIGAGLALEKSGVEDLQSQCAKTFFGGTDGAYISFNSGDCGMEQPMDNYKGELEPTTKMCGLAQRISGCSFIDFSHEFTDGTQTGMGLAIVRDIC